MVYQTCLHFRSWVRLVMGNYSGALEDANEALKLAPQYIEVTQVLESWLLDLKFKESFKESNISASVLRSL